MKHLLAIEQLTREEIEAILDRAESFAEVGRRDIKKVPTCATHRRHPLLRVEHPHQQLLRAAAKRLSADLVSVKAAGSSVDKGESLKDTVATLSAYDPAAIVIRHPYAGAAQMVAAGPRAVVNAGDGKHEHPSQALLDVFTCAADWENLTGCGSGFVGDVLHKPGRPLQPDRLPANGRRGHRLRPTDSDPARDRGVGLRGLLLARPAWRGGGRLRPENAAGADEREFCSFAA